MAAIARLHANGYLIESEGTDMANGYWSGLERGKAYSGPKHEKGCKGQNVDQMLTYTGNCPLCKLMCEYYRSYMTHTLDCPCANCNPLKAANLLGE